MILNRDIKNEREKKCLKIFRKWRWVYQVYWFLLMSEKNTFTLNHGFAFKFHFKAGPKGLVGLNEKNGLKYWFRNVSAGLAWFFF